MLQQLFVAIPPCRIIDTRVVGGPIPAAGTRAFEVLGVTDFSATGADQGGDAACTAIPTIASAVFFNLIAVNAAGPGDLRAWDGVGAAPNTSVINYEPEGADGSTSPMASSCRSRQGWEKTSRSRRTPPRRTSSPTSRAISSTSP